MTKGRKRTDWITHKHTENRIQSTYGFYFGIWQPNKESVVEDLTGLWEYVFYVNSDGRAKTLPKLETKNTSVESRTETLLKLYWQNYNTWKTIADKHWIKVEVAVAIAWADTHLWYAIKTENNIWNVWNTDSGRTRTPNTLEQWIEAIFYTLNNKYLGNKQTIWDLSYAWDCKIDCTKVYATSNDNRQNNVLNLLSLIYMEKITADFEYRI